MKTVGAIFKRDVLALVKNPIALIVVAGLLVLPGLYAWYCIVANWDPYANTGRMPIAVVNEDRGAKNNLAGEIDIGKQVSEKLADNDSIDWRFYDKREEALRDTESGEVYATLVMPEDLSENMLGILEGSDKPPTIYYYPNEKYSAVATKVTDSAAQTLIRQINQGFSSTVSQKVLGSAQDVSHDLDGKIDKTKKSAVSEIEGILADLEKARLSLDDAASAIAGWRDAAAGADAALAVTYNRLPEIRAKMEEGSDEVDSLRAKASEYEGGLSKTILDSASTISDVSAQAATTLNNATADLKTAKARIEAVLNVVGDASPELKEAVERLEAVIEVIDGAVTTVDQRVSDMNASVQEMSANVKEGTSLISSEVMPQLDQGAYELGVSLSELSVALGLFEPQVANLRSVLSQTDSALASAESAIANTQGLLGAIEKNLKGTTDDIGAIRRALEVEKVSEMLHIDPENAGTFLSMPVELVTEKICPVSNYGTAVAPFYTNLALWVGCFILVSVMRVEVTGFSGASARQRYFGRWLLFVILSFIQSQIICGVDILLGIDCANPGLFMLAGAVCSFVYMNLIYALVKIFRNIGKSLCIFLLIMQVPGSSGMYPIQMMPEYFQFIHPALPFTYGIHAMREALSGTYGMDYVIDLVMLLLIVPGSLLIGLGLRAVMSNILLMFDDEASKTGFFASEEAGRDIEREGMRGLMRALVAHGSYADDIEERAWRFNRIYPRLRRIGDILVFAIPFALLVLMFPLNLAFNLSTDTKLTALVIMLLVLFIVQIALIILEYTNRSIKEETRLIGANILGDLGAFGLSPAADSADDAPEQKNAPNASAGMVPATQGIGARGRLGSPTLDVFLTDVRLGFKSIIGVVIIVLLVVTPAMYAWFNLAGSWDPYSNTGGLKVAVANEDEGYKGELVPITINVGNTLASQLRGNNSFDWEFVDADEAVGGVESSKYYAAIVIPKDFSSSLLTYLTEDSTYPKVVYYTNQKENPIAPIITQKGADSIQESIRASFTQRVSEVVLTVAYDVLNYVKKPEMSSYVTTMSGHLDDAMGDTKGASREIRSISGLLRTTSDIVATLGVTLDGLKSVGASASVAIADAKSGAENAAAAFERAGTIVEGMLSGRDADIDKIRSTIDRALEILYSAVDVVPGALQERIDLLEELANTEWISKELKEKILVLVADLKKAKGHAESAAAGIRDAEAKTDELITNAQTEVNDTKAYFKDSVKPSIDSLGASLASASESTSEIVDGLKAALAGINESTGGLSSQLSTLSDGLAKMADKLETAATGIESTKKRVADALRSGDLKQIEDVIVGGDPEVLAASLATPIKEQREALYAVENFGSAMAPFYTVLSLWVGALVMVSTMRVRVAEERIEELRRRYGKVRPRHEFFGRYGIFGFIGLLQSLLVLLGDLMFLHIQCVHPVLFVVCGIFIGQVFCLFVYTISELFGDVGKAICVILLIMQVAASGGTFPVQMLDPRLIALVPFLPFHYAMILLQECVAGIFWPSFLSCIWPLLLCVGVLLVFGLPLRKPFHKVNDFVDHQLERTGYM